MKLSLPVSVRWVSLAVVAGLICAGVAASTNQSAFAFSTFSNLSNRSPTPLSMTLDRTGNNDPTNITRHILLHSDHGNVHSISLGLYYTSTAAKKVTIVKGAEDCSIGGSNQPVPGRPAIKAIAMITFTRADGTGAVSYYVPKNKFCNSGHFYKEYTVPSNLIANSYDPVTQRYKVNMTISYVRPENFGTANDTTATFSVLAVNGLVGNINTDKSTGSVPNNSILGNTSKQQGSITAVYPFGLSCNETTGGKKKITFYDSDNGQPNVQNGRTLYYYIEEQQSNNSWRKLTRNDYATPFIATSVPPNGNLVPFNGNGNPPSGGSVYIKDMKPQTRYRMTIRALWKRNGAGSNYVYVGLPGDSIFGAGNFTCRDDYELEPSVELNKTTAEAGEDVQVTPSIDNNSAVNAGNHNWQVARLEYDPSNDPDGDQIGLNGSGDVCPNYSSATRCDPTYITPGAGQQSFPPNTTQPGTGTQFTIPDTAPVGTTFCFVASVQTPTRSDVNKWSHSDPICVTVGKKPKVQIWGYDGKVVGDINTSLSYISGKNYGSYGEYGLVSDGTNFNMASGNGLLGGENGARPNWSALTFANVINGLPGYGQYNGVVPLIASQSGAVDGGNNVTLGSKNYSAGTKAIVHYTGTLTINGSLTYDNTYSSITKIPRVVIIADNVVIGPNATRIDPWIITNNLSTCSEVKDGSNYFASPSDVQIDATMCDKSLTFNGPVIAKNAYLYRTAGNGKSSNNHAEVFNLRPDAFLSAYAGGGTATPVASTDAITEVPPRF